MGFEQQSNRCCLFTRVTMSSVLRKHQKEGRMSWNGAGKKTPLSMFKEKKMVAEIRKAATVEPDSVNILICF